MNSLINAAKICRLCTSNVYHLGCLKYSSAAHDVEIKIPKRIPRGPTDILKALEKTISFDTTGPSYKFFDDPFLTPGNDRQARMFALSKSAGQKAARWVRDEHPELFTHVISEPAVMSYMPAAPINQDTVNNEMLFEKIRNQKVEDAIKVFEIMQEKNIDVPQDIQMSLLELLCFYNCEDPVPLENNAERYYGQKPKKDFLVNTWKGHPVLETLFQSLKSLGSAPYSALICGLLKAGAKTEADKLVEEAKANNIKLDVNAYNFMILRTISIYDKGTVKWDMVLDLLKEMKEAGIKPNLGTLNAAMDALSRCGIRDKYTLMLQLIAEFMRIGIPPSPGTYGFLVRGLLGKNNQFSGFESALVSILNTLKGQNLKPLHQSDVVLFDWLMKGCVMADDLKLATQCLELFLYSKNRSLLDGYRTNIFFNNFFLVLGRQADYDTILKYYNLLVPHAHTANPEFYKVLFEACDANGSIKDIPQFWNHYMASGLMQEDTLMRLLEVSVSLTGLPDPEAAQVRNDVGDLAHKFLRFKMDSQRNFESVPLTSEMCNLILILLARGSQWRSIQMCLMHMAKNDLMPDIVSTTQILESCQECDNTTMAVWVLKYCHTNFGSELGMQDHFTRLMKSNFLTKDHNDSLREVFDDTSSSSSSSSDSSESDDDSSGSDEDISIPRKSKSKIGEASSNEKP